MIRQGLQGRLPRAQLGRDAGARIHQPLPCQPCRRCRPLHREPGERPYGIPAYVDRKMFQREMSEAKPVRRWSSILPC